MWWNCGIKIPTLKELILLYFREDSLTVIIYDQVPLHVFLLSWKRLLNLLTMAVMCWAFAMVFKFYVKRGWFPVRCCITLNVNSFVKMFLSKQRIMIH